jgi:hypothetical protein
MYSCNAMSPEKSYEHNRDHMLQTFEMVRAGGAGRWLHACLLLVQVLGKCSSSSSSSSRHWPVGGPCQ